jgi:hypothetical protein
MRLHLLAVPLIAGCALIDAATSEKPSPRQQTAIGDTFSQLGAIASIADDPASASAGDLATAVEVEHLARLIEPSLSKPSAAAAKPSPVPECATDDGSTVSIAACEIALSDGRGCVVDGSVAYAPAGDGTRYQGQLGLGGAGCPTAAVTFDVTLVGDPSSPTAIGGSATFSWDDPAGDSYSGSLRLDDIAVTGDCTVPSAGEMTVRVTGTAEGKLLDGAITLSFHDDPGCGVILIE